MRRARVPVLLTGVVTGVHLVMAAFMRAPVVMPDEGGYIDGARFLALGGSRPVTNYYPGLSLLLAPVWKLTTDPLTVWRATLIINSVAAGVTAAVVWSLIPGLGFGRLSGGWRLGLTLVISAYPALFLYTNLALAESLFALVAVVVVALAVRAAARGVPAWLLLGLVAGLLIAVHPRGAGVAIAVFAVGAAVLRPWQAGADRPARIAALTALAAGLTLGSATTRALIVAVRPAPGTGLGAYSADAVVGRVIAAGSLKGVIVGAAGEVLYLTIATAGLAPFGAVLGLVDLAGLCRGRQPTPAKVGRAVAGLSSLGILAMSALFLNGGDRSDHLIYGRYNEGAIAVPLVLGLSYVITAPPGSRRHRCLQWLLTAAAGLAAGGLALELGVSSDRLRAPLNPATVLGLVPILRRATGGVDPTTLVGIGAIVVGLAVLGLLRVPRLAVTLVGVAFLAVAADTFTGYLVPGSDARARQDVLATTIAASARRLHIAPSCVGYDAGIDFTYFNDRFYLPGWKLVPFNGASGAASCGPLVISSEPNFTGAHPGVRTVNVEDDILENLYVLPGPVSDRLAAAGWTLPSPLPGPLPADGQRAVVAATNVPRSMHQGTATTVKVTTRNAGTASDWPNLRGLKSEKYVVRLTARWFAAGQKPAPPGAGGAIPIATTFAELPRPLLPGQQAQSRIVLAARTADGTTLPLGHYVVQVVVYEELVGALPGGVATYHITVVP